MNLLVDPIILALPNYLMGEEICISYLYQLSSWSRIVISGSNDKYNFFLSESCYISLLESKQLPSYHKLSNLLQSLKIDFIDCRTAYLACKRIINNLPYFEDRIPARDLPLIIQKIYLIPDLLYRLEQPISLAFKNTLGYYAFFKEIKKHTFVANLMLVTHPIESGGNAHLDIELNLNEDKLEIETNITLIETPEDLLELSSLKELWAKPEQAINLAINKLKKKGYCEEDTQIASYKIAQEFIRSIKDNHYEAREELIFKIYTKIALLLLGKIPHRESKTNHRLKGINNSNWEPWRVWVTSGHLGMRLHYWWNNGIYIFSKVGPHNDFTIGPEPKWSVS